MERGDTATLAGLFADSIETAFPTGPLHRGRANVTRAFAEMFTRMGVRELQRINPRRIVTSDIVVETGAFSLTFQPLSPADAPPSAMP